MTNSYEYIIHTLQVKFVAQTVNGIADQGSRINTECHTDLDSLNMFGWIEDERDKREKNNIKLWMPSALQ